MSGDLLEDSWSAPFANLVGWYAKRLIGRKFFAMRMLAGYRAAGKDIAAEPGPVMIVMNHSSWWDPMLVFALRSIFFPMRSFVIPMDRVSLEKFRFMRKCGMFGIDPDDPNSLALMAGYLQKRMAELPRCTIGLTPQGRFVDVRDKVQPRPGAAALLSRNPSMRIWSLSSEYGFWQDQRPEIFLRITEVARPEKISISGWQRQLGEAMESNQRLLEEAVKSRNPEFFESILGDRGNKIHPLFDMWQRIRGKSAGIETGHRNASSDPQR